MMNSTEYKHETIIPNESIPVKIFSFSAHNDLRIIPHIGIVQQKYYMLKEEN